jgi:hypothetical protein
MTTRSTPKFLKKKKIANSLIKKKTLRSLLGDPFLAPFLEKKRAPFLGKMALLA